MAGAGYRTFNIQEEEVSKALVGCGTDGEANLWFVFRQDLKDALLRRVRSESGEGSIVNLLYNTYVVAVDTDVGIIKFADGTLVEADLIIGK